MGQGIGTRLVDNHLRVLVLVDHLHQLLQNRIEIRNDFIINSSDLLIVTANTQSKIANVHYWLRSQDGVMASVIHKDHSVCQEALPGLLPCRPIVIQ